MFSQRIRRMMEHEKLLTANPQTTVSEAARLMARGSVSAVVVVEDELVTGIFTERDAVFRVLAQGRDADTTRLVDVMTPAPVTVDPDRTFGHALQLMHSHGFRHMPVVENGKPVGIVSARDALDPEMEEFVCEVQRREGIR
jgi:CBS domain-containing protein